MQPPATPTLSTRLFSAGLALFLILCLVQTLIPTLSIPLVNLVVAGLSLLTLGVHEVGHLVFGFFGEFIAVLGGTLGQILFPLILFALALYRPRDCVIAPFFAFWLGHGLLSTAVYIADARSQSLPLASLGWITGGEAPGHDWNYLLGKLGLLPLDAVIGGFVYVVGLLVMAGAIALAVLLAAGFDPLAPLRNLRLFSRN